MIDIRVENDPKSESHLSMHMGIAGYKQDVEIEMACIPAAMIQAYIQRMEQEGYIHKEIREDVLKLVSRIDRGIRNTVSRLVKAGDL